VMDAFWAVPEWAPAGESHLLESSSAVREIFYGKGSIAYSTFDAASTDVLKLDFEPNVVTAGGRALPRRALSGVDPREDFPREGFSFDPSTGVLRLRHRRSGDVLITGNGGNGPLGYVSFDNPHWVAGTVLKGEYPDGIMSWESDSWIIHVPAGKFGTFNLAATAGTASFQFLDHKVFAGLDVYNAGTGETRLTLACTAAKREETTVVIKAGQLNRVRTGWQDACDRVSFISSAPTSLLYDNLAYLQ
jgi:hypothetical protein